MFQKGGGVPVKRYQRECYYECEGGRWCRQGCLSEVHLDNLILRLEMIIYFAQVQRGRMGTVQTRNEMIDEK